MYVIQSKASYGGKEYTAYWSESGFFCDAQKAHQFSAKAEAERMAKKLKPKSRLSPTEVAVVSLNN